MSIADKLTQVAENIPKVYSAGQSSMVDQSKLIPKTASGSYISVDDVSEIPHSVGCKVESVNLVTFDKKWNGTSSGITITVNDDGSITANGTATSLKQLMSDDVPWYSDKDAAVTITFTDKSQSGVQASITPFDVNGKSLGASYLTSTKTITIPSSCRRISVSLYVTEGTTVENFIFYPMLNLGTTALPYTPYVKPEDVKVTRCGKNLLNPNNLGGGELVEFNGVPCYKFNDRGSEYATTLAIRNQFKPNTQYTFTGRFYRDGLTNLVQLDFVYTDGTRSNKQFSLGNIVSFTTTAEKTVDYIHAAYYDGRDAYLDLSVSCLNVGTTALPYEPYNGQTLTPSADGTVEGLTSVSPYMNIFSDTEGVNIEATYNKSYGMQTEYDRFWDIVQSNGTRRSYVYGFAGATWKKENFKPKYDLLVTNGNLMFAYSAIKVDLVEYLESIGIRLDFTGNAGGTSTFQQTDFTRVGVVDFSKVSPALNSSFANSEFLETIDELILSDKGNQTFTTTFSGTSALKNIKITGVIGNNISFSPCPLSKASIISIINALSDSVTGKTLTLNLSAVNTAFETSVGANDGSTSAEFAALVATKANWTITMV